MRIMKPAVNTRRGVHPNYNKGATASKQTINMPPPAVLRISMSQHLGAPSKPIVKKGDKVLLGQKIAEPSGFISAAVHSPVSGVVAGIVEVSTPNGGIASAIEIQNDGLDTVCYTRSHEDWNKISPKEITQIVGESGIVGMGGAGFPTHVKLSPPPNKKIDTLIINGAECEPYLTADHRLMLEKPDLIWRGIEIIRHVLGASNVRIAIEDNKPDAIIAMEKAIANADENVAIVPLKTLYPQGAEKQQIYAITGREVPSGGLPMDVGCLVENVATTVAIYECVVNSRPLIDRITTVTGAPLFNPSNINVRIGTSYSDVIAFSGGCKEKAAKWISGGPMMGFAVHSLDMPITKTTSGIVGLLSSEIQFFTSDPCISCGRCVSVCPMNLMPCELSKMLEAEDYAGAESLYVLDCIECGCCAFECPSHRPLVQHMRRGKAKAMARRKAEESKKNDKQS